MPLRYRQRPPVCNACTDCGRIPPTCAQGGFALIVALVLMTFLLLILLSLGAFTQVDIQRSQQDTLQQQARQNALLGMQLAVASLQTFAGADQRATATATLGEADTFDGANSTAHRTALNGLTAPKAGTRHWTGIWGNPDAPDMIYTKTPTPVLLNWLVSGNEAVAFSPAADGSITSPATANTIPYKPDNTDLPANLNAADLGPWALLVGSGSVNVEADYVVAPKVEINGDTSNRYAWWIGDEGVKARYNLRDHHDTAGSASLPDLKDLDQRERYRLLLAQRSGIEILPSLGAYPVNPVGSDTGKIDAVLDRSQLQLSVSGLTQADAKDYFHDIGFDSLGLLADSQSGGLRRDLSHALTHNTLSGRILPDITNSTNVNVSKEINDLPNPRWELLKSFYNQVVSTIDSGSLTPATGSADIHAATPVILQIRTLVRLRVEATAAADDPRNLYLGAAPIVVLGNPYNVPLHNTGVDFRYHAEGGRNGNDDATPIAFTLKNAAGTELGNANTRLLKRHDAAPSVRSLLGNIVFRTPSFTIPAGGTIVFSLKDNVEASGSGLIIADMIAGTTLLDPDKAVDIHIGDVPASELSNPTTPGGSTREWEFTFTASKWGHFSFSMYESTDSPPDHPLGLRPLQRVEQLGLGGSGSLTSHSFDAPDKDTYTTGASNPEDRFADSFFEPYFYRLFHMVTPEAQFASQRLYANYNMRAQVLRRPLLDNNGTNQTNPLYFFQSPPSYGSVARNAFTDNLPPKWGNAITPAGTDEVVLFDMLHSGDTNAPLLSIASLRHANLGFIRNGTSATGNLPVLDVDKSLTLDMSVGDIGGYAVGSSWANPYVRRDLPAQGRNYSGSWETYFDTSYLLNTALFDGYFFSTVPQTGATLPDTLPNNRLLRLTDSANALRSTTEAAEHLLIEGAFNVNSTSIKAWESVLAGMRFPGPDGDADTETLFLRSLDQPQAAAGNSGNLQDAYAGYRSLTDDQITALAQAIVSQVRQRGPFMSLGHFVNRKLATNDVLGLKGALQSALDNASTGGTPLNNPANFENVTSPQGDDNAVYEDPQAALGPQAAGIPGWLSQGDLLQALAPILSARSDTFIVRSYGEVLNPHSGAVEARAWCEALVQRTPEAVTPEDAASPATPADASGRRFRVVSFRWLTSDEI